MTKKINETKLVLKGNTGYWIKALKEHLPEFEVEDGTPIEKIVDKFVFELTQSLEQSKTKKQVFGMELSK